MSPLTSSIEAGAATHAVKRGRAGSAKRGRAAWWIAVLAVVLACPTLVVFSAVAVPLLRPVRLHLGRATLGAAWHRANSAPGWGLYKEGLHSEAGDWHGEFHQAGSEIRTDWVYCRRGGRIYEFYTEWRRQRGK
jgi:hypothetical protein